MVHIPASELAGTTTASARALVARAGIWGGFTSLGLVLSASVVMPPLRSAVPMPSSRFAQSLSSATSTLRAFVCDRR